MTSKELNGFRLENKMTIQALADTCGFSHSHMWKMCRGYKEVSTKVEAILNLLEKKGAGVVLRPLLRKEGLTNERKSNHRNKLKSK